MEQMYLIEIFIDKVTIFASEEEAKSGADKNLIIKIKFGPKGQFIIKEGQLALNETKDDIIECDEQGRRKWTRTIRVGKSFLFPSYPDTVMMILSKFPLEIEVWNDDENEVEIFVGIGTMHWETQFFHMLRETADSCKLHNPLSIKQQTPLFAECCCKRVGEINFILRLSALGETITTEFQQLMKDPDSFVFRTNKAPSMFQCKRIEGDDPNFCMVGSLYETTTLEDPDIIDNANNKIEICTELQSCGGAPPGDIVKCKHEDKTEMAATKKTHAVDKIRMGDITGPCGNPNCPLAHKIKTYIRNLEAYKQEANTVKGSKDDKSRKICGGCDCKDDRWHRDECPTKSQVDDKTTCSGCGGLAKTGDTCDDRRNKQYGTGATPKGSKTLLNYVFMNQMHGTSIFGKDYTVENVITNYNLQTLEQTVRDVRLANGCSCRLQESLPNTMQNKIIKSSSTSNIRTPAKVSSSRGLGNYDQCVFNIDVKSTLSRNVAVYNCTEIPDDKDCKCSPPKPTPPCKTFDCDCITEVGNIQARKTHKAYCPLYKHKTNCPVTMMQEDEEKKEDEEDETEPLPYGLPPIKLGPCPVLGRPCTVPDGFARMYKVGAQPQQPPSYSDAGKVCCSKEYERIKKAIKDYMKYEKDHDYRCINKFDVDTERRCCDKEQRLMALTGKSCCGSHKMAIQDKYNEKK